MATPSVRQKKWWWYGPQGSKVAHLGGWKRQPWASQISKKKGTLWASGYVKQFANWKMAIKIYWIYHSYANVYLKNLWDIGLQFTEDWVYPSYDFEMHV